MSGEHIVTNSALLIPPLEYFNCSVAQRHLMFTPSLHALGGYGPKSSLFKIRDLRPFHAANFAASSGRENQELKRHGGHAAILVLMQCSHKFRHVLVRHRSEVETLRFRQLRE